MGIEMDGIEMDGTEMEGIEMEGIAMEGIEIVGSGGSSIGPGSALTILVLSRTRLTMETFMIDGPRR